MQRCTLPLDIFSYILTLDKYYLPVSSFLALRASCRQVKALYTKQKYIDKYSKRITLMRVDKDNVRDILLKNYNILPNQEKHGVAEEHHFRKSTPHQIKNRHNDINFNKYATVAESFGLKDAHYIRTHTMQYYLGNPIWPSIGTEKLLGDDTIKRFKLNIDKDTIVSYWIDKPVNNFITEFNHCKIYIIDNKDKWQFADIDIINGRANKNCMTDMRTGKQLVLYYTVGGGYKLQRRKMWN